MMHMNKRLKFSLSKDKDREINSERKNQKI